MTANFWYDEMGTQSGQPVRLLEFTDGTTYWRYTTCAYDVAYGATTFTQQPGLVIGPSESSQNESRNKLEITVPWSNVLLQQLLTLPPDDPISVTEYKMHIARTGIESRITIWKGWLLGYEMKENHLATLMASPYWSDLGVAGACLRSSKMCQVPLGSTACGVVLTDYDKPGIVTAVDGDTVTANVFSTEADGYWVGGMYESVRGNRMIVSHTGTSVILSHSITDIVVGDAFTCTPGCDHEWMSDCDAIFGKKLNFRGQPHRATANLHKRGVL